MNMPRGQVGAGSRVRQTSNVMRHDLTFDALRLTNLADSSNAGFEFLSQKITVLFSERKYVTDGLNLASYGRSQVIKA